MTDLVTFGEALLRLSPPRGDRLETADTFGVAVGGPESNVAVGAARLDANAVWLSKLPDSPHGNRVAGELRRHGVRTGVAWTDPAESRAGVSYLERGGDPRGPTVHSDRADTAFTTVRPGELPTEVFVSATAFHVSGVTLALSSTVAETTAALLSAAGDADVTRSLDLRYRPSLWSPDEARAAYETLFPDVDRLFVPRRDAIDVLGAEGNAVEIAHGLETEFDFETVVVTRNDDSALAIHDDSVYEQDAYAADTVEEVGAMDAFVAGYLAKRLDDGAVQEALQWAAAAAALKRTIDGDLPVVTADEVERVVGSEQAATDEPVRR